MATPTVTRLTGPERRKRILAAAAAAAAARVLLVPPRGDRELEAAWRRVQREATAALTGLLASGAGLPARTPARALRLELFTEFIKQGMHGLADWWNEHPDTPRAALVDAAAGAAWNGVRSWLLGGLRQL